MREVTKGKRNLFARMIDVAQAQVMNPRVFSTRRDRAKPYYILSNDHRSILDTIEILRHDAPYFERDSVSNKPRFIQPYLLMTVVKPGVMNNSCGMQDNCIGQTYSFLFDVK